VNPPEASTATQRRPGRKPLSPRRAKDGRRPRPLTERQRRLRHRALPLAVLAGISFIVGAVMAAGSAEEDTANRFLEAWAAQDFAAMHEELTDDAKAQYPVEQLAAAYQEAQIASTATAIDPGDAEGPRDDGGTEVVEVGVGVRTELFGVVDGTINLPVSEAKIDWAPHLTFPGLQEGERVGRKLELGGRAAILAADGTPLAQGDGALRTSRLGSAAIDVAGQLGEPEGELKPEVEKSGYPGNQETGVSGLELAFNSRLAGRPGGTLVAVREGTELPDVPDEIQGRALATAESAPGEPLKTTVDPKLQEATVSALAGRSGGIAVLDARTGAVKALAGSAYSSPQPPGSTFKVITTTAGLEQGVVKLDEYFTPVKEINPAPETGANVIENAHDEICGGDFVDSFARSCNTVFAPLGIEVGGEKLVETAERYGYNEDPTLYDAEATEATDPEPMTMPTSFDETGTELAASAIGQGKVLATPLGMASVVQAIAAGGTRAPTPLVSDPALQADQGPVEVTSRENARVLTSLMEDVVNFGTGQLGALPGIQVAGKTGTAELGPKPNQPPPGPVAPGEEPPDPEQIVDAWFIAFAPSKRPKLAVAVMLIDAEGDGGEVAAPIAREILAAGLQPRQ
jgi:penicillin-binding protein A